MEIEYNLTPEDLLALQRHIQKHKPKPRRNPLVSVVIWVGVSVVVYILLELQDIVHVPFVDSLLPSVEVGALMLFVGILLGFFGIVLSVKLKTRHAIQKALKAGRNAEKALGWRRMVLDAHGVCNSSKLFSSTYQWRGIDEVATTDAHIFLYFTTMNAFIVPRRGFPSNRAFDDFVDAARRYHNMAGVGDVVWEMTSDGRWERGGTTGIQAADQSGKSGTVEGIVPKEGL